MTIAYQNTGTAATGTNVLSIPYPSGISAGDILLCCISSKGGSTPTTPPTKPTGWEIIVRRNGGSGTAGADSGTVWVTVFAKIAVGTESGNLSVTTSSDSTNGSAVGHIERWTRDTSKKVIISAASGTDTTGSSTAFSAATSHAIDFTGTDILLGVFASNTDGTTAFTGQQFTASGGSGSTISGGSITNIGTFVASEGYDVALGVFFATTTGWSGNRTVTLGATGTNSGTNIQTGSAVVLRMREVEYATPLMKDYRNTTLSSLTYVGAVSEGDLLVITAYGRFDSVTMSGWTQLDSGSGAAGSEAADSGTGKVVVFTKVADGTENESTFSPSFSGATSAAVSLQIFGRPLGGTDTWELDSAGFGDSTPGTSFTGVSPGGMSLNVSDIINAVAGINTDAYSYSSPSFSSSGVTFSTAAKIIDQANTAGNDSRALAVVAQVTAGYTWGSSEAPVTFTATASGSSANAPCGGIVLYRVRLNEPAAITSQPTDETANSGATAIFTVGATGTDVQYQWQEGVVSTDADFQFSNPAGTTLESIDSKWEMDSTSLETNGSGQLQPVAGSVWVDVTARYVDSQPDTQFFEMVVKAGDFGSGQYRRGYLQHDGTNEGYRFEINSANASISRDGTYANASPHGIDPSAADYTVRGEYDASTGVVKLLLNGVEVVQYTDSSPLTGGTPAIGFYAAGTLSNARIESFKCTASTGSSSWSDISGETSNTFETDTLTSGDDGKNYRVRVYNDYASLYSNTVTLTVEEGGITGTFSTTDAGPDTASISGGVVVKGSLSVSEAATEDSADVEGKTLVSGEIDSSESGPDTMAATGLSLIEGTADLSEAASPDTSSTWGQVYTDGGYSPAARVVEEIGNHAPLSAGGSAEIVVNGEAGQTALVILGVFGLTTAAPTITMPEGWDLLEQSGTVDSLTSAAYSKKLTENTSSIFVEVDIGGNVVASVYTMEKVSDIAHALFQAASSSYSTFDPPSVTAGLGTQNYLYLAGALVPNSTQAEALTGEPSGYYEGVKEIAPGSSSSTIALRTAHRYDAQSSGTHNPSAGFTGDPGSSLSSTYIAWTFAVTPEILGQAIDLDESGPDVSDFQGIVRDPIFGQMDTEEDGSDAASISGAGIVQGTANVTESGSDTSATYGQVYNDIGLAPLPDFAFEGAGVSSDFSNTSHDIPIATSGRQSLLIISASNSALDNPLTMPAPWVKLGQSARFGSIGLYSAVFYNPEASPGTVTVTGTQNSSPSYIEYSFEKGAKVTGTSAGRTSGTNAPNPPSHSTGFGAQNSIWIEHFALKPNSAAGVLSPSTGYTNLRGSGINPNTIGSTSFSAHRVLHQVETEDPAAVAAWNNAGAAPSPAAMWTLSIVPGVSGAADVAENTADTALITGGSVKNGDADLVESGVDTMSSSGKVIIKGTLGATESSTDTFSSSGKVFVKGTAALQESGADAASINGGALIEGDLSASEVGSDAFVSSGKLLVHGVMTLTEVGDDISNISGANQIQGSMAPTEEGSDSSALVGGVLVRGNLGATEGPDTASLSGEVITKGTLAVQESGSDLSTILGTNSVQGYMLSEELAQDTASLSGKVSVKGTANASETGQDVASISGASVIGATVDLFEAGNDTFVASGDVFVQGLLAATDGVDVAQAHGKIIVRGSAAWSEAGADTANMTGLVITGANVNAVEQGPDEADVSGVVVVQGSMAVTDVGDNVAMFGDVLISGGLSVQESGGDTASLAGGKVYWQGSMSAPESGPDTVAVSGLVITNGSLNLSESGQDSAVFDGIVFWTPLEGTVDAVELTRDSAQFLGESVVYTKPRSWLVQPEDRKFEINAEDRSFNVK